jgi:hypothetical protein
MDMLDSTPVTPSTPHTVNRFRNSTIIRRSIGAAVLSLVLGQWTLLVHAIEHAHAPEAVAEVHEGDHAWGHQAGSAACHLFDQLLSGQAPGAAPAMARGPRPGASPSVAPTGWICPGPEARAYEARGPPPS